MIRKKWLEYAEEQSKISKAYAKFYNSMQTDATRSSYSYNMKRFMDFLVRYQIIKTNDDYDSLAQFENERVTDVLEEFVARLNKELQKTSAVKTMLAAPELFFEMNRKMWHKKLVRRGIKKDGQIKSGKLPATNEDVQRMLDVTKSLRDKIVIHFLASTGSRPAGITDPVLKMKHLVKMPQNCYGIKIYDESEEGYWGFLTPEASKALDRYFSWRKGIRKEEFNEETPIFANHSRNAKYQHMSEMSLRKIVENAIQKAGIERTKVGSKYDKATITMFRKRFNGKLKMENRVNSNIAEKLMAHKRGLDATYLQPTREECFAEFVKAVSELTVSSEERQKLKLAQQEKKISEYQIQQNEIKELKQFSKDLSEQLNKVTVRSAIEERYRQQTFDWSSKNLTPENYAKITRIDFSKVKGIDEMVEHILTEHPDKIESSTKFELKNFRIVEN